MKKYVAKNHYKNSKGLLNINAKKKKKLHLPTLNFMDSKKKKVNKFKYSKYNQMSKIDDCKVKS